MASSTGAGLSIWTWFAGAGVAAVAGTVGYQVFVAPERQEALPDTPTPAVAVAAPEAEGETSETAAVMPVAEVDLAQDEDAEPALAPLIAPRFDLVRVDAAGGALIAGSSEPNAELRLRLDGDEVHLATADGNGEFVAMFGIPGSETPQILTLEMVTESGEVLRSEESVIISPTLVPAGEALAEADTGSGLPGGETSGDGASVELAALDTAPETATPISPETPAVPASPNAETASVLLPEEATDELADETGEPLETPVEGADQIVAEDVAAGDPMLAESGLSGAASDDAEVIADTTTDPDDSGSEPIVIADVSDDLPESPISEPVEIVAAEVEQPLEEGAADPAATSELVVAEAEILVEEMADASGPAPEITEAVEDAVSPPPPSETTEIAALEPPQTPEVPIGTTTDLATAPEESPGLEDPSVSGTEEMVTAAPETETGSANAPIIALTTPQDEAPAAEESTTASASDTITASEDSEDPAPEPATVPQAPTVMIADAEGIRVIQSGDGPQVQSQIVLDTISYDAEGEVILAGRGPSDSDVRFYLDNQPIQLAEINTSGAWRAPLPAVDPGTYTLRLDEVAESGAVESQIETPFLREDPDRVASLPRNSDGQQVVTVQWGHTLWGLAQEYLGEGVAYVQVYEANRDQIRNPDLIYPGQIFAIPEQN